MKPTRCTLLLSIFISTSLHVSGNYVPIIKRTYCIYATLVFFTLMGTLLPETCSEVEINILRSSVHLVGFTWRGGGETIVDHQTWTCVITVKNEMERMWQEVTVG